MRLHIIKRFAKQFWTNAFKSKVILPLLVVFGALTLYATYTGCKNYTTQNEMRLKYQAQVRHDWEDMPDKHPHRMAHYGYLAFRLKHPLSIFDYGMESYVGNSVYLEAHKQNTVNFSEASFSTGLLRFGEISLALLLQIVLPLMMLFLGFNSVAGERENHTLKIVLSQGVSWQEIIGGKAVGLSAVAMVFYIPIFILTICLSIFYNHENSEVGTRLLGLLGVYFIFFTLISFMSVLISAHSQTAKTALVHSMVLWLFLAIVLPRSLQAVGNYAYPTPSKIAFEAAIEHDIIQAGDSHNPDDPHYKAIKDSLLWAYKVDSIHKLPFNYSGFIMKEGERISAEIYNQHLKNLLTTYEKQNRFNQFAAFLNPFLVVKTASMTLSGTDFSTYNDFQNQAETFRYALAQRMNDLQIQYIRNQKLGEKDKPYSIEKKHWQEMPDFNYRFLSVRTAAPKQGIVWVALGIWIISLMLIINNLGEFKI